MACCHQATSHYLSQCWPRSMLPCGITRPQWVKLCQEHVSVILIQNWGRIENMIWTGFHNTKYDFERDFKCISILENLSVLLKNSKIKSIGFTTSWALVTSIGDIIVCEIKLHYFKLYLLTFHQNIQTENFAIACFLFQTIVSSQHLQN